MQTSLSVRRLTVSKWQFRLVYALLGALWLVLSAFAPIAHAEQKEQLVARKPFVSTVIHDAAVTKNKAGTPLLVSMPQGINTPLQILDLKTLKGVQLQELRTDSKENAGRAFVTLPNRHVLVGTDLGYVYDVDPDKLTATEQEAPEKPAPTMQQAVLGSGTTVYFSGEMGGATHVYAYDTTKGSWQEVTTVAAVGAGIAYDDGKLYIGDTTTATLWQVKGGAKTSVSLQGVPAGTTGLQVVGASGGYLYVTTLGGASQTLVYKTADMSLVDTRVNFGRVVAGVAQAQTAPVQQPVETPQSPAADTAPDTTSDQTDASGQPNTTATQSTPTSSSTDTHSTQNSATTPVAAPVVETPAPVYFGGLNKYEPTEKSLSALVQQQTMHPVYGGCWVDSGRCVIIGSRGELGIVSVNSRKYQAVSPSPLVGGYHAAGTIQMNEQNVMYAAGAGTGSSVLQVTRDKSLQSKMISAGAATVTSVVPVGSQVVAGTATGEVAVYNPSAAATIPRFGKGTALGAGSIDALVATSDVSVVAALNQTGPKPSSSIAVYDVANGAVTIQPALVLPNQTVASLAYGKGVVFGGGATSGQGASLFAYDLTTKTLKATIVPVSTASRVSSLVMHGGYLYGVADNIVFKIDPSSMSVVEKKPFYATSDDANLAVDGEQLVASVGGKIYQLKPEDLSSTYVANGSNVAVDSLGDYYYTRDGGIYRILTTQEAKTVSALQPSSSDFGFSGIDWKIGLSGLAVFLAIVAITILKLHTHRKPTYSLRR